jgi:hypothetical protein
VEFNVSETEIIPYGTEIYCKELLATRKLNHLDEPIHIAKEGEAVRILGGYVGNGIDTFEVWTLVLDKIDSDYECWANINPTMNMRKNINQIVAGSRTQYLAQVNRMLPAVLKHVLKSQQEFINEGKLSMVSRQQLMAPIDKGRLGMLALEAISEALQLVKAGALVETHPKK